MYYTIRTAQCGSRVWTHYWKGHYFHSEMIFLKFWHPLIHNSKVQLYVHSQLPPIRKGSSHPNFESKDVRQNYRRKKVSHLRTRRSSLVPTNKSPRYFTLESCIRTGSAQLLGIELISACRNSSSMFSQHLTDYVFGFPTLLSCLEFA